MRLTVDRVEYLSGDRHLYGTASGIGAQTRVVSRLPATVLTPIASGQEHEFAVASDRLRFFDAATGKRTDPVRL
jgi:multiple sugar transport system ATP-binding protein